MSKINIPLSSDKVKTALGPNTRILKYSDLKQFNTIQDLLPNKNDFVILLIEDKQDSGHWTCIMNTNKGYYYFNSYGGKYDSDLSVIPMCIRSILGQNKKEITRLLGETICDWNKKKYQGERSMVCGRYCILAITMICMMGYTPKEFEEFLTTQKDNYECSYDELIASLVAI